MNKADLIERVAAVADISKAKAGDAVNGMLDEITKSLAKGTDVALIGFGTFKVSKRKARTGRNPQTGAEIRVPACNVPSFKAGKPLKTAVNK